MSTGSPATPPTGNSDDIIFTVVKGRLADQNDSIKALDTKAALTLTFVSAVLAGLVNSAWFTGLNYIYHLLILSSLLLTGLFALIATLVRDFRADPDPASLIAGYSNKPEHVTKGQLILNYQQSYDHNAKVLKHKILFLQTSFILLAIAVGILVTSIFFSLHPITIK